MSRPAATGLAARLARDERGVTVVEAMVAALLLVIGALAVLQLIDTTTRNSFRVEESQVVTERLQSELEQIRRLPYSQVALTTAPTSATDLADPRRRVNATRTQFAVRRDGAEIADLVVNPAGGVNPGPEPFQVGDISGKIYRFVVWQNDYRCDESRCPGTQDRKRVVVAVRLDKAAVSSERPYQELQSDFVDPSAQPVPKPLPPGGPSVNAQSLRLTDTTCNHASRQPITSDHGVHNTLGACSNGLKTGDEPGAPDRLFTKQTPLDPCCKANAQPLYDFATEIEPVQNPDLDKGLQILAPDAPGCTYTPPGASAPRNTHRWVTAPMATGFTYVLEGAATLKLWTRTINNVSLPGRICVFLFTRESVVSGGEADVLIRNSQTNEPYFIYDNPTWPPSTSTGGWVEVTLPMQFEAGTRVFPGERLGIAIQVERGGTNPGEALQFMYDHPSFDTRLEVRTSTPLP